MQHDKVKSAARVIEILEYFSEHREPARMSELTAALGYPASSVTALLRTLVAMGYMDFDQATHRYFPATRLSRLTNWMEAGGYEQTTVLDAMHKLRELTEEPVVLAAPDGVHIEYFISLHRSEGTTSHIKTGSRRLMIQNGIGWLMLSRAPLADALTIYRKTITAGLLAEEKFSEAEYAEHLDRHRGTDISVLHAKDLREPTAHWNASMISTLIPVPKGHHRYLGVGVHGPTPRMTEKADMIAGHLRDRVEDLRAQV